MEVYDGTTYEWSASSMVNSGTDGVGMEVGSSLGDGVGVVAGVGVGEGLFEVWFG